MQSCSKIALSTIRPLKSDSPSPGLSTTPSIAAEYDDRAPARVSTPNAQEGALSAGRQSLGARARGTRKARTRSQGSVRRAPCALVVLVPRRRLAARGTRRAGGRARLSGARADRPRRRLRLARVCARGEALRRPPDHR